MPVSHVGLTVSHLPTSTSFFLQALAPLGYKYITKKDNQVAFGIDTPDFYLSQQTPCTPPGPAHIAFAAPSHTAVDSFFVEALKAGGQIYGEPRVRDPETGYYSAAVLDFDRNSIEVVHRPASTIKDNFGEGKSVVKYQSAGSVVSRSPTEARSVARSLPRSVTMPLPATSRPAPQVVERRSSSDMTSKTLVGALIGAAAGALVAYAAMKEDQPSPTSHSVHSPQSEFRPSSERPAVTGLIEMINYLPQPQSRAGSTISQAQHPSYYPLAIEAPPPVSTPRSRNVWAETVVTQSDVSRHTEQKAYSSRPTIVQSYHSMPVLTTQSVRPTTARSSTSSSPRTVIQADYPPIVSPPAPSTHKSHRSSASAYDREERKSSSGRSHHSSHRTEPVTVINQASGLIIEDIDEEEDDHATTVAPSDSISQAGTRKSRHKHRRRRSGEKTVVSLPVRGSEREGDRDRGGIRSVVTNLIKAAR